MRSIPRKLLEFLLTLLFTFLFIFVVPILYLLLIVPTVSYRFLLSKYAKWQKPHLERMVEAVGSVLAAERVFSGNAFTEMVTLETMGEPPNVHEIRKMALENVVNYVSGGKLQYPELQQTIKFFKGYAFWCKVKDFRIEEHVRYLHDVQGYEKFKDVQWDSERALADLLSELTSKSWVKGRPLWEIIIIPKVFLETENPNSGSGCGMTFVLFRMHHALGDGLCILRIFPKIGGYMKPVFDHSLLATPKGNFLLDFLKMTFFYCKTPFEFSHYLATVILDVKEYSETDVLDCWSNSENKNYSQLMEKGKDMGKGVLHSSFSRKISIQDIKDIKNAHGVTFTSVVLATVTSGVREMYLKMGVKKMPRISSMGFSVIIGHKDRMQNQVGYFLLRLPTGEPDPLKRLQKINRDMKSMSGSTVPWISFWLSKRFLGLIPTSLIRWIRARANWLPVAALANLLGPNEPLEFGGNSVLGLRTGLNPAIDCNGWMFQFITYNGHARLVASGMSQHWPTQEFSDDVIKYTEESLKRLQWDGCDA